MVRMVVVSLVVLGLVVLPVVGRCEGEGGDHMFVGVASSVFAVIAFGKFVEYNDAADAACAGDEDCPACKDLRSEADKWGILGILSTLLAIHEFDEWSKLQRGEDEQSAVELGDDESRVRLLRPSLDGAKGSLRASLIRLRF